MSKQPNPTALHDPESAHDLPNGSPPPSPSALPTGSSGPRSLPTRAPRAASRVAWFVALAVLVVAGGAAAYYFTRGEGPRVDVLTHKVVREPLRVTVTEKGTFESAENRDIICKVRAGSKGFASTINEVVPDGTRVKPGDLLMVLDDSALKDQEDDQRIKIAKAEAEKVGAETNLKIVEEETDGKVEMARASVENARIELEKYTGLSFDPTRAAFAAVGGITVSLTESGAFRQSLDDLNGQISLKQSEAAQNQERADWAQRMVKQSYMSPAQAQAERSRLESSIEALRSLQAKRAQLLTYDRRQQLTKLGSDLDAARRALRQAELEKIAKMEQARSTLAAALAVLKKEEEKLSDPVDGILKQREWCNIKAPADIKPDSMVVYFKPESSGRSSSSSQTLIEQGAQVKESQKLLRIPNLDKMQVNTKVHEAMVSRIRLGQRATVKVDALPERQFAGVVRWKAPVANPSDWGSDVKLYQTIVRIEGELLPDGKIVPISGEILSPDMTAEVTISVDAAAGPVLTVPSQALLGGAEMGEAREVFVKVGGGYERRQITLGLYNDRMVEVRTGLEEGDEVVTNPKVLLTEKDKTRTREAGESKGELKYTEGGKSSGEPGAAPGGLPGGEPGKKGAGGKKAPGAGGGPPGGPGAKGGPPAGGGVPTAG